MFVSFVPLDNEIPLSSNGGSTKLRANPSVITFCSSGVLFGILINSLSPATESGKYPKKPTGLLPPLAVALGIYSGNF